MRLIGLLYFLSGMHFAFLLDDAFAGRPIVIWKFLACAFTIYAALIQKIPTKPQQ